MTEKIAGYARVSTEEQSLDRQLSSIRDYAERTLGGDLGDLEIYRDKSTGTDTERSGYQDMMADAEAGEFDAVVVHSISRISRSISDLDATARRLEDAGVALHIVSEGLQIQPDESDPFQRALFQLLGVFAEFEAEMARARTKEGIAARQNSKATTTAGRRWASRTTTGRSYSPTATTTSWQHSKWCRKTRLA